MSDISDENSIRDDTDKTDCLIWTNHQNHLPELARELLREECMLDCTLYAEGHRIYAHKIILSACSALFQEILSQVNDERPTIILSNISAEDAKLIVEFCYNGEVKIPVENINSLLEAADYLKIHGLMNIQRLDEVDPYNELEDNTGIDNMAVFKENFEQVQAEEKPKKKKVCPKRFYDEQTMQEALEQLKQGHSLIEVSKRFSVPRSTLYMKAKAIGVPMTASRNEYSQESMKSAIDAVVGGCSLQNAADTFGIPKTVLWRRIQKEGIQILKNDARRSYDMKKREEAIRALARGENLTKVSQEYQIPKTTLFRDKVRLVGAGKLPLSFWKKRNTESEELKKSRLEEAVTACREGRMSQATASVVYQIPKTTIWRRIQAENGKLATKKETIKVKTTSVLDSSVKTELVDSMFQEYDSMEIPISYIDEASIPENSVIILSSEDMEGLGLDTTDRTIAVSEDFMNDSMELEDETEPFQSKKLICETKFA